MHGGVYSVAGKTGTAQKRDGADTFPEILFVVRGIFSTDKPALCIYVAR